jgi:NAD(P)H-dependent FMN reductase
LLDDRPEVFDFAIDGVRLRVAAFPAAASIVHIDREALQQLAGECFAAVALGQRTTHDHERGAIAHFFERYRGSVSRCGKGYVSGCFRLDICRRHSASCPCYGLVARCTRRSYRERDQHGLEHVSVAANDVPWCGANHRRMGQQMLYEFDALRALLSHRCIARHDSTERLLAVSFAECDLACRPTPSNTAVVIPRPFLSPLGRGRHSSSGRFVVTSPRAEGAGAMNQQGPEPKLRVLILGISLRADSLNRKLAASAARVAARSGAAVELASMRDFDVPSYDGDEEVAQGIPRGAEELKRRLVENDAFIVSSPEYNGSMPGLFKNLIDWTSRFRPQPFDGKHGLLMSASPSMGGGNRGLWALRIPLEHLGARIFPDMFSLSTAHTAFKDDELADARLLARFEKNIEAFLSLAEAAKHYPCIKRAWVEFLGEPPGMAADRVDPMPA